MAWILLARAVCLLALIAGLHSHRLIRRSLDLTDLDRVAQDFVYAKAQEVGRKVSWWDLYGEHQHLRERPQYNKFKVDIRKGGVEYGTVVRSAEMPQKVQTKTYVNRTNRTINSVITWETRHASTFSWRVDKGFRATWDGEIETSIPFLGKPKNRTTVSVDTSREQVTHDQDTFSIRYSLQVPPHTQTTAQWVITEKDQELPFNIDLFLKGYIAVWFSEKWDGHWLWFFPISHFRDPRLVPFEGGLRFRASGVFRGIRGVDSHIEVTESSLSSSASPDSRTYVVRRGQRLQQLQQQQQAVPGD